MITQQDLVRIFKEDDPELSENLSAMPSKEFQKLLDAIMLVDKFFLLGAQLENHHEYTSTMMMLLQAHPKYSEEEFGFDTSYGINESYFN